MRKTPRKATIAKIVGNSAKTIDNWEKENRPIIKLFDLYFKEGDLIEFLEEGRISKFEKTRPVHTEDNLEVLNSAYFKLKTVSERESNDIGKTIAELKCKKNIRNILPLKSFMEAVLKSKKNGTGLQAEIRKLEVRESRKDTMLDFVNEELSVAEANQLVFDVYIINERIKKIKRSMYWV